MRGGRAPLLNSSANAATGCSCRESSTIRPAVTQQQMRCVACLYGRTIHHHTMGSKVFGHAYQLLHGNECVTATAQQGA